MKQHVNKTLISMRLRSDIIDFYRTPPDGTHFQLSTVINTLLREHVKRLQRDNEMPKTRIYTTQQARRHSKYRVDTTCLQWLKFWNVNVSAFVEDILEKAMIDGTWKKIKRKQVLSHTR